MSLRSFGSLRSLRSLRLFMSLRSFRSLRYSHEIRCLTSLLEEFGVLGVFDDFLDFEVFWDLRF